MQLVFGSQLQLRGLGLQTMTRGSLIMKYEADQSLRSAPMPAIHLQAPSHGTHAEPKCHLLLQMCLQVITCP